MGVRVTAVVISHDQPTFLAETLLALQSQTEQPQKTLVIDTSSSGDCLKVIEAANLQGISLPPKTKLGAAINAAIIANRLAETSTDSAQDTASDWLWILHDDSAPEPTALAQLLAVIEQSPSVAVAGPKQVQWKNKRLISQLGLTLTPTGKLFSVVSNQLDQSQHDDVDDVLAVGTAGVLIKTSVYRQLKGFDDSAPPLAADVDFSIRTRLAGYRVVAVPLAKIRHAELSLKDERPKSWLGASSKTALRRAEVHLRLAYLPIAVALAYWLILPAIGIFNAVLRVSQKRPNQIAAEIASAFWGFFTIAARLKARKLASVPGGLKFKQLDRMRATWRQVRTANRAQAELEQSQQLLAEFEKGEQTESVVAEKGFFAGGAAWWFIALALVSAPFWPIDSAITGGQLLPLSDSWFDLFKRAGASWQPIGNGFFGPSDPQVWLLLFLASFTFWSPSLAISILIFLAKPLAFAGAFKLASLFTDRNWLRILAAMVFALSPLLAISQAEGYFSAIVLAIGLPWFALACCRIAGIGSSRLATRGQLTSQQTWSWVGVAGLLFAAIGSTAPNAIAVLVLLLAAVAFSRIKKIGYLIWVGLPLASIAAPFEWFLTVGLGHPLAGLTDPGVAAAGPQLPELLTWMALGIPLVALVALLQRRLGTAIWLWVLALAAVGAAWLVSRLEFVSAQSTVSGSPLANLEVAYLALMLLAVLAIDQINLLRFTRLWQGLLATITVATSTVLFVAANLASPVAVHWSGSRVVPSIVKAEYDQGNLFRLLEIKVPADAKANQYAVRLLRGDGLQLEDSSVAYQNYAAELSAAGSKDLTNLASLVGNLVSGNAASIQSALDENSIGYVLIGQTGSSARLSDLAVSLDSAPELEPVGLTDFGRLWRVRQPQVIPALDIQDSESPWSITKAIELSVLGLFVLLALPSPRGRRRVVGDSNIFDSSVEEVQS